MTILHYGVGDATFTVSFNLDDPALMEKTVKRLKRNLKFNHECYAGHKLETAGHWHGVEPRKITYSNNTNAHVEFILFNGDAHYRIPLHGFEYKMDLEKCDVCNCDVRLHGLLKYSEMVLRCSRCKGHCQILYC